MFTARNLISVPAFVGAAIGLTVLAVAAPVAAAAPADPVLAFHAGLLKAAKSGWPPADAEMAALIARDFDLPAITRVVMGAQANVATAAQKERLSHALVLRIEREVLRFRAPTADDGFAVTGVTMVGANDWLVATRAKPAKSVRGQPANPPTPPTWRVHMSGGKPEIIDTLRQGVSMIQVQKDDFSSALHGRNLDQVIALIEQRAKAEPAQW